MNLIDTPGHVDFSYEVSRSIAACEGALLIVDAAQSIQAQTISNLYLALENDLEIIPVLNKVDLPSANPEEVTDDIVDLLGCKAEEVIPASAKTGLGIEDIINAIISVIPAPKGSCDEPLQALIFDSVYNPFRGVETYFRVINGSIKKNQVKFLSTGKDYGAEEVGTLKLSQVPRKVIKTGDVGYLITGIKDAKDVKVGDTIDVDSTQIDGIAGFEEVKPMVFAGIYPVDTDDYEDLRSSMEKLQLNDASLVFQAESSAALGFGFRCGFLGMLHLEIIQERLEREFNMTVITTVPNVSYHAFTRKNPEEIVTLNNPSDLPDPSSLERIEEPFIKASIITKADFVGPVMSLCINKRGVITNQTYLTSDRVELSFDMPLAEIVFDFYDRLKTISKGYASFDYAPIGLRPSKLVKVDILLNASPVDALSALIHADNAYNIGKKMCEKLRQLSLDNSLIFLFKRLLELKLFQGRPLRLSEKMLLLSVMVVISLVRLTNAVTNLVASNIVLFEPGSDTSQTTSIIEYPNHSVKSNRNYQVGIVLSDRYGRTSTVILSNNKDTIIINGISYSG